MSESSAQIETQLHEDVQIDAVIEAILFVADEPIEPRALAATLGFTEDNVLQGILRVQAALLERNSGLELRQVAGGWRLFTVPAVANLVERYVRDGQIARLTQASLETLAVIAYKQPVSRARISAIRGVNVDSVVKTLESRGLIEVESTDSESGALLYRTTKTFLEKLGLDTLGDLPDISQHIPDLEAAVALQENL